jgi:hypothetical protein
VSSRPLRKKLTYRDNSGRSQAEHAALWAGFSWQAGPVIVAAHGPWGTIQCWAATEAEGRRVIAFAASAGGWNLEAPGVEWSIATTSGGRNGRTGRMVVKETPLGVEVTKRAGPSGFPSIG